MVKRAQPFYCKGCQAELSVPKASFRAAVLLMGALGYVLDRVPLWGFVIIAAGVLAIEWLTVRVRGTEAP
jgi:hypothetical protein